MQPEARKPLVELAREYHCLPVAIVLDLPERLCQERNRGRPDRDFGPHVVRQPARRSCAARCAACGARASATSSCWRRRRRSTRPTIEREPLWNDRRHEHGPFDIIGDVHGCCDELDELLGSSATSAARDGRPRRGRSRHPEGRKAVFVGDLVDRGPRIARRACGS